MRPKAIGQVAGICMLSAGAVHAQELGACGQFAALTERVESALSPGFADIDRQLALPRSEVRYLEFTLTEPQPVFLLVAGDGGDPALALFGENGQLIVSDDDSAGDLNALIETSMLAGTYCAQVRDIGSEPALAREFRVLLSPDGASVPRAPDGTVVTRPSACQPGTLLGELAIDSAGGLSPIAIDGTLPEDGDRAGYRLTLGAELAIQIDAKSSDFDTLLEVTDAVGVPLHRNDDFEDTDSRIAAFLEPGEYCVSVESYNDARGRFTMAISEPAPDTPLGQEAVGGGDGGAVAQFGPACADPENTPVLAENLGPDSPAVSLAGALGVGTRSEYLMSLAAPTTLQLDVTSGNFDTILEVYTLDGELRYENDDHPQAEGTNSRLVEEFDAGAYCVTVRGYDGTGGTFEIAAAPPPPGTIVGPLQTGDGIAGCSIPELTGTLDGSIEGEVAGRYTFHDYRLQIPSRGEYRIEAGSAQIDTVLSLFDANGTLLDSNDDHADMEGTDSRIDATLAGEYCLRVESLGQTPGRFTLAATPLAAPLDSGVLPPMPGTDEIESLGTVGDAPLGSTTLSNDQALWTAFEVTAPARVEVGGVNMLDRFTLYLADAGGAVLGQADSTGDVDNASLAADLAPGTYFAVMVGANRPEGVQIRQITVSQVDALPLGSGTVEPDLPDPSATTPPLPDASDQPSEEPPVRSGRGSGRR